ncbi:MAG: tetratricopeptide repeat protein [Planctomycetota bacterium]
MIEPADPDIEADDPDIEADDPDSEAGESELVAGESDTLAENPVRLKRIALIGKLGGMNRRQATRVLRSFEATVVGIDSDDLDWVVIGADEAPIAEADLLTPEIRRAAADGFLEIVSEADLWQRLGLVDPEQSTRRYYTPAMLAELLDVSVRVIRRWHRRGLIQAVRTLHQLPYFDFSEVATARRLAQWIASGASPKAIEQRLVDLVEVLPNIRRPLDQLSILIEGRDVLLRGGEGLLDTSGQMRFDFDSLQAGDDPAAGDDPSAPAPTLLFIGDEPRDVTHPVAPRVTDSLLDEIYEAEDAGDLELAIELCHALLARDGPRADVNFQVGELLYRSGEIIAARERYFVAIELDPEFVEARASLGNVLAETRRDDLAVAAYEGALSLHPDYADVHFGIARTLTRLGEFERAREHWKAFVRLSPQSPWADEARAHLDEPENE